MHGDFSDVTNGEKECFPTRSDVCVIIISVYSPHILYMNTCTYLYICIWRSRTGCSPRGYETRNPRRAPVLRHPVAARRRVEVLLHKSLINRKHERKTRLGFPSPPSTPLLTTAPCKFQTTCNNNNRNNNK